MKKSFINQILTLALALFHMSYSFAMEHNIYKKDSELVTKYTQILQKNYVLTGRQSFIFPLMSLGGDEGTELAKALEGNRQQILDLHRKGFSWNGATAITKALAGNITLKKLDLSYSQIGNNDVIAIFNMLISNNMLEYIKLTIRANRDQAVIEIAEVMKKNETLKVIEIYINHQITDNSLTALLESLKRNHNPPEIIIDASEYITENTLRLLYKRREANEFFKSFALPLLISLTDHNSTIIAMPKDIIISIIVTIKNIIELNLIEIIMNF